MQLLLLILAVIFFILAGLNVRGPRFVPEWFGLACLAADWGWPLITA
jgi:uncharacterized membrane protein YhdT